MRENQFEEGYILGERGSSEHWLVRSFSINLYELESLSDGRFRVIFKSMVERYFHRIGRVRDSSLEVKKPKFYLDI